MPTLQQRAESLGSRIDMSRMVYDRSGQILFYVLMLFLWAILTGRVEAAMQALRGEKDKPLEVPKIDPSTGAPVGDENGDSPRGPPKDAPIMHPT